MTALLYPGMIAAAPAPTEPPIGNASFGPVGQQAAAPTSPAPVPTPAPAAPAAPSVPSWGGSATVGSGTPSPAPAPTSNTGMIGVSPAPTSPPVGAPAPATPAVNGGDWAKEVAGLNWAVGEGARSTANLWAIKNSYNLSDDQLATAIKDANGQQLWTGAQLGQHFQRFGYGTTWAQPGVTGEKGQDGRITDSPMDFSNETIQGRLGQVLATDDKGNYTNPSSAKPSTGRCRPSTHAVCATRPWRSRRRKRPPSPRPSKSWARTPSGTSRTGRTTCAPATTSP